jgi:site-specific recombinase XerD
MQPPDDHTPRVPFLPAATRWNTGRFDRGEIRHHTWRACYWHIRTAADLLGPDTPVQSITRADLESVLELLPLAPRSANQVRSTLRQFFGWATDIEHLCFRNPAAGLRNARTPRRQPRRVPAAHVTAVLEHADLQGRAMVLLAAHLGLRRSEIAGLRVEDFDQRERTLHIRAENAKGEKDRTIAIEGEALHAVRQWLGWRERRQPRSHGPITSGPMWPSRQSATGLSHGSIYRIMTEASRRAGHHYAPHRYRHTAATAMLLDGAPVEVVRRTLGHEDLATLSVYTAADVEECRPWVGRRTYLHHR